jgi:septal ring factor EnvC (AmiA/AmiB activator)
METNKQLIDELYQEIKELKKDKKKLKGTLLEQNNMLDELAMDISGLSCLIDGLTNLRDLNDELFMNSCRVLARNLEIISKNMEDR